MAAKKSKARKKTGKKTRKKATKKTATKKTRKKTTKKAKKTAAKKTRKKRAKKPVLVSTVKTKFDDGFIAGVKAAKQSQEMADAAKRAKSRARADRKSKQIEARILGKPAKKAKKTKVKEKSVTVEDIIRTPKAQKRSASKPFFVWVCGGRTKRGCAGGSHLLPRTTRKIHHSER